jgi:hypothetical protein
MKRNRMRTVERIELPSTNAAMMRARSATFSLFILTIMLERASNVKSARKELHYGKSVRHTSAER